jgi:D-alanyl-D-alanine carboxypeptidase
VDTPPISAAPVGRAFLILAFAAIGLTSFVAFTPVPHAEGQNAALSSVDPFSHIAIEAKSAIVIDMRTGETLYEKNADAQLPLASLTKVVLALVVAEALPLDTVITIPYYAGGSQSDSHLLKGERWRLADVIDFTLVESSNNGAGILAEAAHKEFLALYNSGAEGPYGATLARMNELARALGLLQTYFLNVSGLDLSTTQAGAYGSARDMAKLFAYAASAQSNVFAGTARDGMLLTTASGETQTAASNTNEAQGAIPGLIMGKTGFTDLAGGNLAVVFDVGLSHPVVAVLLGSTEDGRFADMRKLVEITRESLGSDGR